MDAFVLITTYTAINLNSSKFRYKPKTGNKSTVMTYRISLPRTIRCVSLSEHFRNEYK